jgi:hypothetical protein
MNPPRTGSIQLASSQVNKWTICYGDTRQTFQKLLFFFFFFGPPSYLEAFNRIQVAICKALYQFSEIEKGIK